MSWVEELPPLVVVVGGGGVGKTTLAAALGLRSAAAGRETLVMTFDPSLRLKDALGVGEEALDAEVPVVGAEGAPLAVSLLDARRTFDRLVERYAPDEEARERIVGNRYYRHLAGSLAGILEYMAVERLFEVAGEGRYQRIVLDTPPTRQALDFLEAPARIVDFLDSGALKVGMKRWFDQRGRFRPTAALGGLGKRLDRMLDHVVGLELLRDITEFFRAFGPLYAGFRDRANQVGELLRSRRTLFVLVSGAGEERIADTLFFARKLREAGHQLGPIVVNRLHPTVDDLAVGVEEPRPGDGRALIAWLGRRDRLGLDKLRTLVTREDALIALPLLPEAPTDLAALERLGRLHEG